MKTRFFYTLLLALALLFAQQGAALHALSHLADGVPEHSQQEKHLPHSPACDKCVAYAGVGSAAFSAPFTFEGQFIAGILAATVYLLVLSAPLHAYRSRAPPRQP